MDVDDNTLTMTQVERLAADVRRRVEELRLHEVRCPDVADYLVHRHAGPDGGARSSYDFAVEVDIGPTTIGLRSQTSSWRFGDVVRLADLAKAIVLQILRARGDREGLAALKAADKAVRAKVRRDRSRLSVTSVRYAPAGTLVPEPLLGRCFWVQVELLDDLLTPSDALVTGRTVRGLCRELRHMGESHMRRLDARDRLHEDGGVLEIDAAAEHAIRATGWSVREVAGRLLAPRAAKDSHHPPMRLWTGAAGERLSVGVRDGCIVTEARFLTFELALDGRLLLDQSLPETIVDALSGKPLGSMFDHPFIFGGTEMIDAARSGGGGTRIRLQRRPRSIRPEELNGLEL